MRFDRPATQLIAEEYLSGLKTAEVDVLVLGCTHYPLLKRVLRHVMGPEVPLIDSAEETAIAVAGALCEAGLDAPADATPVHRFAVSDDAARFRTIGARFIGERMGSGSTEVVDIGAK